jgi:hypothetical protein
MKRIFTIFCMAFMSLFATSVFAQDTLVAWTFPSTSADKYADFGVAALGYSSRFISCQYGYLAADTISIDYTTNGSLGSPDKCAKAVNWTLNPDSANWMVKFKTAGYGNLKLYSKQQGGGSNPGPRDFKVQYKLPGSTSPWIDLPGGTITCANDWTTGVVNGIDLPATCENQSSQVGIRWIVTSQIDITGGTLLSTGISKIDDIVITGTVLAGVNEIGSVNTVNIYPNPNNGSFCIDNNKDMNNICVYNILGKCVYTNENIIGDRTMLTGFEKGMYIIQITTKGNTVSSYKIIVD